MAKFFTKKVCLIILAVIVAMGGIIWAVVANITPKFRSGIDSIPAVNCVSGNGTASVMVDDYLYFIGDSVKTSSIKYGDNEYFVNGVIPDSGIFRVKIGEENAPELNYEYDNTYTDENTGEKAEWKKGDTAYNTVVVGVKDWDNIGNKNNGIQAVVPKIAGHDKTAMWVFGKYLIYTSPHNRYDNRGNLMSNYLDFFRVDLDGKNHTLIYTTDSTDLTTENFTVWADAKNNINLLVFETDNENEEPTPTVKKINVITKVVTVLDSNVTNVVLPTVKQYGKQNESLSQVYGGVMGYVYYTKERKTINENSTLKGNLLYRCAVNDGEPEVIADFGTTEKGTTFTPLAVTPLNVDGAVASAQFVFSISVVVGDNNAPYIEKNLCVMTNQNMNDFNYVDPEVEDDLGLTKSSEVAIYANGFCTIDSKLYPYIINGTHIVLGDRLMSSMTVDSVLAVIGNDIYVQSGSTVYKINKNGTYESVSIAEDTDEDTSTEDDSSSTGTEESTSSNTMPVSVLYQPQGNTGNPMIFVHSDNNIRLVHSNKTYNYVRFKQS